MWMTLLVQRAHLGGCAKSLPILGIWMTLHIFSSFFGVGEVALLLLSASSNLTFDQEAHCVYSQM